MGSADQSVKVHRRLDSYRTLRANMALRNMTQAGHTELAPWQSYGRSPYTAFPGMDSEHDAEREGQPLEKQ
jgi:hypothetical protein